MRDATGGSMVLSIIVVFIVFGLGYMAFNVNYMKAFRMKNKIIAVYEDYGGECETSACSSAIKDYAKSIGYNSVNNLNCPSGFEMHDHLYCIRRKEVSINSSSRDRASVGSGGVTVDDIKARYYYNVVTKINISIPGVDWILDLRFFYISGDTKSFEEKD